ncbi:MAG TPA: hypothetical protein PLX36_06055 [Pseudomonadales bacterium]|nr:hypothetical protein [Pseudomonadales bacterium]
MKKPISPRHAIAITLLRRAWRYGIFPVSKPTVQPSAPANRVADSMDEVLRRPALRSPSLDSAARLLLAQMERDPLLHHSTGLSV